MHRKGLGLVFAYCLSHKEPFWLPLGLAPEAEWEAALFIDHTTQGSTLFDIFEMDVHHNARSCAFKGTRRLERNSTVSHRTVE